MQAAEERTQTSVSGVVLGLIFGAVGALLVIIGGVGLPAASVAVSRIVNVTPAQQADMDALMRIAPVIAGFGVAQVIAGLGLMTSQAWGRAFAAGLSVGIAALALAGIVFVADRVNGVVDWTSQAAQAAATGAVATLAVVAAAYVVAALAVVLTRPSR